MNSLLMEEDAPEEQVWQMKDAVIPAGPPFLLIWSSTGELWPIKTLSQDSIMTPILAAAAAAATCIQIKRQCETSTSAEPTPCIPTPPPSPTQFT